jgi:hypothetical protein
MGQANMGGRGILLLHIKQDLLSSIEELFSHGQRGRLQQLHLSLNDPP